MIDTASVSDTQLDRNKFSDPDYTADGNQRAKVAFAGLETLWFNTGTLCNLTCNNCYIESSPTNDSLVYLSATEVATFLDEIERDKLEVREIGFTGGEPFMNQDIIAMMTDSLERKFRVLVLSNAMRPMMKLVEPLLDLRRRFGDQLIIRVSLDHYTKALHEMERGDRSWGPTLTGIKWLAENDFTLHIAGRTCWRESEDALRLGFARLFTELGIPVDAHDPVSLVLFPEMDSAVDVPEITVDCWDILGVNPRSLMCATSRMVIKHKGADSPVVTACTLVPHDLAFETGRNLAESRNDIKLNHPHCARFCVLGGTSCG